MPLSLTYHGDLSYVLIDSTGLTADEVRIERGITVREVIQWTTVRGGVALDSSGGAVSLRDYEFGADIQTHYRVVDTADGSVEQQGSITASLDGRTWLKSIRWPFLNRPLFRVLDRGDDIQRPDRGGVFEIVGRSVPITVEDVRGSQRFTLYAQTQDDDAARVMDLVLAASGIMLIHAGPDACHPVGYVHIDTTAQQRRTTQERFVFQLPCTVDAPPGPDVVGSTMTLAGLGHLYGSLAALSVNPTLASLAELVGIPEDLVVP